MGCKILGNENGACFYDSVTEACFGLKMENVEEAEDFQNWISVDLRTLSHNEFSDKLRGFREQNE